MKTELVRIFLIPASDDAPLRSAEYQEQLSTFHDALATGGLEPSSKQQLNESFGAATVYLGEFGVVLGKSLATILPAAIGAWLHAKYGRKVRLKIDDIEVEAQTVEEVEQLLARAEEIQQRNQPKVIHEP